MTTLQERIAAPLVAAIAGLLLTGCVATPTTPVRLDVSLPEPIAYDRFWGECLDVVRGFGFDLDRADPAAGVITTLPTTSKQWFEFWRRDTLGAQELLESSLHTLRRRVQLTVRPAEPPGGFEVAAHVLIQRQSRPERQMTTPATALQAFGSKLPTASGQIADSDSGIYWTDQGADDRLAAAVLAEIARRWPGAQIVSTAADPPADPAPQSPPLK